MTQTNEIASASTGTGSRFTFCLGLAVIVGVVVLVLLGFFAAPEDDEQRDAVIALHQQVMQRVAPNIDDSSETYEERQLAHALLNHPRRPLDLDLFSQGLRIQSMQAEAMLDGLRERLLRDFASHSGSVVAAREGTPLPWWLAR